MEAPTLRYAVFAAVLTSSVAIVGSFSAPACAADIDRVAPCLVKNKVFENASTKAKALCFTDEQFHKISVAEPFLLLAGIYCPGGESDLARKTDIFNEVAQREMGLGGDDQKEFAADQRRGSELAHQVLHEGDNSTVPQFCAEVKELYGARGTEFSGLYSMVGAHIHP